MMRLPTSRIVGYFRRQTAPFVLNDSWTTSSSLLEQMVDHCRNESVQSMVEFGSGQSTLRLGNELAHCRIKSVEHDAQWYALVAGAARRAGSHNIELSHEPLRFHRAGDRDVLSYRASPQGSFQFAFIDGPPHYTLGGREICLYMVFDQLAIDAVVVLDDYARPVEHEVVNTWVQAYGGALVIDDRTSERAAWLRKVAQASPDLDRCRNQARAEAVRSGYARMCWLLENMAEPSSDLDLRYVSSIRRAYGIQTPWLKGVSSAETEARLAEVLSLAGIGGVATRDMQP